MKPIKLKMQAFGAYIERQDIDFRNLNKNGIFLITGSTGGGKTTILDAMCFALYGKSTGGLRSWENMRCIGAPDELPTFVEFEFDLNKKHYKFFRSQVLYKSRKTGETKIKSENACYKQEEDKWTEIISGAESKLNAQAENLLGLDCEQFSKVIVLPQGEFRKLLLSSSNEKGKIFEKLFSAEKWSQITGKIMGIADSFKKQADEYRIKKEEILHTSNSKDAQELYEKCRNLKSSLAEAKAASLAADKELAVTNSRLSELQKAKEVLEKLFVTENEIKALEQALNISEQALRLSELQVKELPKYNEKIKELSALCATLSENSKKLIRIDEINNELTLNNKLLSDTAISIEASENIFKKSVDRIKNGEEYVSSLTKSLSALPMLYSKFNVLNDTKTKCEKLKTEELKFKEQKQILESLKKTSDNANTDVVNYAKEIEINESLIIKGSAAILADNLKDNEPCPVCGSLIHPKPAISRQNKESSAQNRLKELKILKKEAEKSAIEATSKYQTAVKLYESTAHNINEIKSSINKDNSVYYKTFDRELLNTAEEIKKCEAMNLQLQKAQKKLSELQKDKEDAVKLLEENKSKTKIVKSKISSLTDEMLRTKNSLNCSMSSEETKQRLEIAKKEIKFNEDFIKNIQDKFTLAKADTATLKAKIQASNEQKKDLDAANSFYKEKNIIYSEEQLSKSFDESETAKKRLNEMNSLIGKLLQESTQLTDNLTRLNELEAKGAQIQIEYSHSQRLSQFLQGKNMYKIPIKNYVLGIMLDDIIRQANEYLSELSHQRYSLLRIEERTSGNSINGLDLNIFDAEYGDARGVQTLSGGELFLASLSLAFGLSDTVQSFSGGICIDSIFIDEGFGSLDSETIDTAMSALNNLRSMGRTIGIISHVEQLKMQIANRIEVNINNGKSQIKVLTT